MSVGGSCAPHRGVTVICLSIIRSEPFALEPDLLGYTVKNGERIIQVDLKQPFESGRYVGTARVKIVAGAAESAESFCRNALMDDSGEISYGNDRPRP